MRMIFAVAITLVACGGAQKEPAHANGGSSSSLSAIVREGDPFSVLAAFVSTEGIEPEAGASSAVLLGAVVEERLRKAGLEARATPQFDAARIDVLVPKGEGARAMKELRRALVDPINDPGESAKRKLEMLAHYPIDETSACTGEIASGTKKLDPNSAESIRAAASVGFGMVGDRGTTQDARRALEGFTTRTPKPRAALDPIATYEARGRLRARLMVRAPLAVATVAAWSIPKIATQKLARVLVTAHGNGACLSVDVEGDTLDLAAVAIAKRTLGEAIAGARNADVESTKTHATNAPDARDAAAIAAAWSLSKEVEVSPISVALFGADGSAPDALARAEAELARPIVQTKIAIERGQGTTWILLASPCATDAETTQDAGVSALFVTALARENVEPWIASDGIGILAHADSDRALEMADTLGRAIASEDIPVARVRGELLANATPHLSLLGSVLAPGHPSWVVPSGTQDALLRTSDAATTARAIAFRTGPLRVAILDASDRATSIGHAIDRWLPRPSAQCAPASPVTPAPGTYSVQGPSAAYLALPIAKTDVAPILTHLLEDALARALAGTVRSSSVRLLGVPRAPALVAYLDAPGSALDAAVMRARALFDRLKKSGPTQEELAAARKAHAHAQGIAALDPRTRVIRLWRGQEPIADDATIRAACPDVFRDDALVVVASRSRSP